MPSSVSASLQRGFLWLWLSLFFALTSLFFQGIPLAFPFLMSSYMAIRKLKASSLEIDDSNDEDIEMQPLEIAGTTPQLRRRQLSIAQAFQMAFANSSFGRK